MSQIEKVAKLLTSEKVDAEMFLHSLQYNLGEHDYSVKIIIIFKRGNQVTHSITFITRAECLYTI